MSAKGSAQKIITLIYKRELKNMKKYLAIPFAIIVSVLSVEAADLEKEIMREEIRLLKEQLNGLEHRLEGQSDQRKSLEATTVEDTREKAGRLDPNNRIPTDDRSKIDADLGAAFDRLTSFPVIRQAYDRLTITGNVDILYYNSDFDTRSGGSEDTSDFVVDQVRLGLDLEIYDYVKGFVALQFEDYQTGSLAPFGGGVADTEGDGDLQVDEAYIIIGDWEYDEGLYGIFGKQYFPFGNVNESGNFINDTLTRQLYETRDTGLTVGHKYAGLDVSFFAFNGQAEEVKTGGSLDNKVDTWGSSIAYAMEEEGMTVNIGFSYISNILQAQNTAALAGLDFNGPIGLHVDNDSQAYNVYGVVGIGPVWLSAEYVSTFNDLDSRDVPGTPFTANPEGSDVKPQALTVEGAFSFEMDEHEVILAAKYETNNDQEDFGNPFEEIWGVGVGSDIFENTTLTLNYENWNLENGSGNIGGHANVYLAELSIEF